MAKAKATKGKGRGKGKAAKKEEPVEIDETPAVQEAVQNTVEAIEEAAKDVVEEVKDVAEGAAAFVEEMTDMQNRPKEDDVTMKVSPSKEDVGLLSRVADDENGAKEERSREESNAPATESTRDGMNVDGKTKEEDLAPSMSMDERQRKLAELRKRMHDSARQNRSELLAEATTRQLSIREAARRERQIKLAETLRERADAEERGEDVERKKNWEWTIEENDEWEKRKARKERNADFEFHDEEQQARKRYKKDLNYLKPDLETYNKQKQLALGSGPSSSSGSNALAEFNPQGGAVTSYEQQRAAESLYRDANTLLYADNKPSEEAIDRVIGKLNQEQDKRNKFSRKRLNEDEGDITYINERNRVFNKKIARFYDKYTSEIRASFERGTAL